MIGNIKNYCWYKYPHDDIEFVWYTLFIDWWLEFGQQYNDIDEETYEKLIFQLNNRVFCFEILKFWPSYIFRWTLCLHS